MSTPLSAPQQHCNQRAAFVGNAAKCALMRLMMGRGYPRLDTKNTGWLIVNAAPSQRSATAPLSLYDACCRRSSSGTLWSLNRASRSDAALLAERAQPKVICMITAKDSESSSFYRHVCLSHLVPPAADTRWRLSSKLSECEILCSPASDLGIATYCSIAERTRPEEAEMQWCSKLQPGANSGRLLLPLPLLNSVAPETGLQLAPGGSKGVSSVTATVHPPGAGGCRCRWCVAAWGDRRSTTAMYAPCWTAWA